MWLSARCRRTSLKRGKSGPHRISPGRWQCRFLLRSNELYRYEQRRTSSIAGPSIQARLARLHAAAATTFAFAGILAFATVVTGVATAFALASVLPGTVVFPGSSAFNRSPGSTFSRFCFCCCFTVDRRLRGRLLGASGTTGQNAGHRRGCQQRNCLLLTTGRAFHFHHLNYLSCCKP